MSLRTRLISLGATCAALVAVSATPAIASVAPLTVTGTNGGETVSNGVGGSTVTAVADPGPMTFTASTGLGTFPVRVVGQESLHCVDRSGLHEYAFPFESAYETGGSSGITWQPTACPTGQNAVYHQVTAEAEETYQSYVFGEGFRTVTVTTGAVDFSWVFLQ